MILDKDRWLLSSPSIFDLQKSLSMTAFMHSPANKTKTRGAWITPHTQGVSLHFLSGRHYAALSSAYILVYSVLLWVRRNYRCCGSGEGQAQQHQQRDELVARLHVGHGEVTVVATVAHHRGGQHICQLQEIQGHQGGQDDGELDGHMHTHTCTRTRTKQRATCI